MIALDDVVDACLSKSAIVLNCNSSSIGLLCRPSLSRQNCEQFNLLCCDS